MPSPPRPSGRFGCRLDELQKLELLGPIEVRTELQEKVGLEFLSSVTWVVELRSDGTLESVWKLDHGGQMAPVAGRWTVDEEGGVELRFPDEEVWVGSLTPESLSFRHPVVGEVWMERLET